MGEARKGGDSLRTGASDQEAGGRPEVISQVGGLAGGLFGG